MKKILVSFVTAFTMLVAASAQTDLRILNHLSVGAEVGTMGLGVDLAMPISPFVDVQAGYVFIPKISYNTKIDMNKDLAGIHENPVKGTMQSNGGKFLVNVMPAPHVTSFHITAGLYFGSAEPVGLVDREPMPFEIYQHNLAFPDDQRGLALGDYLLKPDKNGHIDATLKTNTVKPYLGIGIGRAVPHKRIGFKVDLGCVFWGKPTIWNNGEEVLDTDAGGDDGGVMKIMTKFRVYPVLNFRLCGRIF